MRLIELRYDRSPPFDAMEAVAAHTSEPIAAESAA